MAIPRQACAATDVRNIQVPLRINPSNPSTGFFTDLQNTVSDVFRQFTESFSLITSPMEGMKRVWTHVAGSSGTFAQGAGITSNIVMAAGSLLGSPIMFTISFLTSTASFMYLGEQSRQAEMLEKALIEFKQANIRLEATNKNLERQNQILTASNQELKQNIADLNKNIRVLETHLGTLQQCNASFRLNLTELSRCIEEFKAANGRAGGRVESISGLERSIQGIKTEISRFSTRLDETQTILTTHTQNFATQMGTLSDTMRIVSEKLPDLHRIQGLSIVCGQFNLALEGMRKHQDEVKQTSEELQRAQKRCADEHAQLKACRLSCEAMLAKFQHLLGERAKVAPQMPPQRVQPKPLIGRAVRAT